MAFERERQRGLVHPAAIVDHFDSADPAILQRHGNARGPGVDRVLQQFLERGGRTLDHFTRSNAVDQRFWQSSDGGHLPWDSRTGGKIRRAPRTYAHFLLKSIAFFARGR